MSRLVCPTCRGTGVLSPDISEVTQLVRRLENGTREVYRAENGRIFVTYGGGHVSEETLQEAVSRGLIRLRWPDCPDYWELTKR